MVATRDLDRLYECVNGTKDVNKAVNRNIERFLSDFYFQLILEEYHDLKFQFGTSNWSTHGGAMLATILRTKIYQ